MRKTPLLAAIVLSVAVGAPRFAAAVETNSPSPPQNAQPSGTTTPKQKTKKPKSSSADKFLNDWHKAYALVYDKGDYVGGIATLRAMGYDDNVDVATLIGYASRKLGRYDDAKYWYDKALAADEIRAEQRQPRCARPCHGDGRFGGQAGGDLNLDHPARR